MNILARVRGMKKKITLLRRAVEMPQLHVAGQSMRPNFHMCTLQLMNCYHRNYALDRSTSYQRRMIDQRHS